MVMMSLGGVIDGLVAWWLLMGCLEVEEEMGRQWRYFCFVFVFFVFLFFCFFFFFFFFFFFCYYGLWLWPMVVQTQATRLVACVELCSSGHGGCGFDSKIERSGEERREREGEVVALIQRWRDQVRREEKERERGLMLNVFAGKKKMVT